MMKMVVRDGQPMNTRATEKISCLSSFTLYKSFFSAIHLRLVCSWATNQLVEFLSKATCSFMIIIIININ